MTPCRCKYLNNISGDVARDYLREHLEYARADGMGRKVYRCDESDVEWAEERESAGYGNDVVVLRRVTR